MDGGRGRFGYSLENDDKLSGPLWCLRGKMGATEKDDLPKASGLIYLETFITSITSNTLRHSPPHLDSISGLGAFTASSFQAAPGPADLYPIDSLRMIWAMGSS